VRTDKTELATATAISLLVTALLYAVPFGRTLAWPLVLVSTLAHELGHGIAAAVLGGSFESLHIHADGSGVALWRGSFGRVATAAVAGAGLVGPAVAAFLLLALARNTRYVRLSLGVLGAGLFVVTLLLVRNAFGVAFTALLASSFLLVALGASRLSQTVVVLLAVQLALSVFSRSDYLFTPTALTASGPMPSDVAVMAGMLFLPYWFWGAVCGGISLVLLLLGATIFFRR
jgi:peptidase M50B-like protein